MSQSWFLLLAAKINLLEKKALLYKISSRTVSEGHRSHHQFPPSMLQSFNTEAMWDWRDGVEGWARELCRSRAQTYMDLLPITNSYAFQQIPCHKHLCLYCSVGVCDRAQWGCCSLAQALGHPPIFCPSPLQCGPQWSWMCPLTISFRAKGIFFP